MNIYYIYNCQYVDIMIYARACIYVILQVACPA